MCRLRTPSVVKQWKYTRRKKRNEESTADKRNDAKDENEPKKKPKNEQKTHDANKEMEGKWEGDMRNERKAKPRKCWKQTAFFIFFFLLLSQMQWEWRFCTQMHSLVCSWRAIWLLCLSAPHRHTSLVARFAFASALSVVHRHEPSAAIFLWWMETESEG